MSDTTSPAQIFYAHTNDGFFVVRVVGRGDSTLSPCLKQVLKTESEAESAPGAEVPHFIIDLANCTALDSTFMGVMAEMGLRQMSRSSSKIQVVNTTPLTKTQMEKLGLAYILDIHPLATATPSLPETQFQPSAQVNLNKLDKILMMIEAHQALIDANSGNEISFRPVIDNLSSSLNRETKKQGFP